MSGRHLTPTKFNYPTGEFDRRSPKLVALIDAWQEGQPVSRPHGLMGVPYDGAIPTRPGARKGPSGIRSALFKLTNFDGDRSIDPSRAVVTDFGNVNAAVGNTNLTHDRTEESARFVTVNCDTPIFLGGDHSLTYPLFKGVAEEFAGRLGLITFDAHHDVREYGEKIKLSGTPFRRISELEDDMFSPTNLVQIGIRPFANSRFYEKWLNDQGGVYFSVDQVREQGVEEVVERALEVAGRNTDAIYLSLDIDVIDQAFAPGSSAAGPGGLTFREVEDGVRQIADSAELAGVDVMETSPPLDQASMTSKAAALLLARVIFA